MENLLKETLIRSYYFAEAMAFYEEYYLPITEVVPTHLLENERKHLKNENRKDARTLTWVPLVFHCTDIDSFQSIVTDGFIKSGSNKAVSLTELPIGELDRMKIRTNHNSLVAIAFPRRYIQTLDFAPVLWTKHHKELSKAIKGNDGLREALAPFVKENDDLGAFQEIRTLCEIPIDKAVWILTTEKLDRDVAVSANRATFNKAIETFKSRYGSISQSHWNRSHQLEILGEWQYIMTQKDSNNHLTDFSFRGEYYWKERCFSEANKVVKMPAGNDFEYRFRCINNEEARKFVGPYTFFDVAKFIKGLIEEEYGKAEECLEYALIQDL